MLFPPEILLETRAHGRQQIVKIHDAVHQSVESRRKSTLTARHEPEADEARQNHDEVVENVEESDLIVFLAQDEKDGVEKIDQLGHVKAITQQDFLQKILAIGVIHRLANETVAVEPSQPTNPVEHPTVENDLKQVVNYKGVSHLERWAIFHQSRSP